MDMWPAFENSEVEALPHAMVVHDNFHTCKHLIEVDGKVRKAEHVNLMAEGGKKLREMKDDRMRREAASFGELSKSNL